ncbi:hypothetical protein KY495_10845 [Massilia sp. PAMC28688]|uniref:hypothetical protein n=1 Tax=Massilia sp. PAMC28688 TaxID=2861283 RepID=UPI001C629162|nr:hypothetical protein [Massilia sp. PAMC28688]QYF95596.1 hypothetical protein KY495_10845 [Massilia sp. PAMC28688]
MFKSMVVAGLLTSAALVTGAIAAPATVKPSSLQVVVVKRGTVVAVKSSDYMHRYFYSGKRLSRVVDQLGGTTRIRYDEDGQPDYVILPDGEIQDVELKGDHKFNVIKALSGQVFLQLKPPVSKRHQELATPQDVRENSVTSGPAVQTMAGTPSLSDDISTPMWDCHTGQDGIQICTGGGVLEDTYVPPYDGGIVIGDVGAIPEEGGSGGGEQTPEECKDDVCEDAKRDMDAGCRMLSPVESARCRSKNMDYYARCLRSCENGDWSWLDWFNYIW